MKVCELIAELQNYPPELEVFVLTEETNWTHDLDNPLASSFEQISTKLSTNFLIESGVYLDETGDRRVIKIT